MMHHEFNRPDRLVSKFKILRIVPLLIVGLTGSACSTAQTITMDDAIPAALQNSFVTKPNGEKVPEHITPIPANIKNTYLKATMDVYSTVIDMFRPQPPPSLPIHIFVTDQYPRTIMDDWLAPTAIWIPIYLDTDQINIDQHKTLNKFAWELAHEMGHVMLDARRNNGFLDTICSALALDVLSRLGSHWPTSPTLDLRESNPQAFREVIENQYIGQAAEELRTAAATRNWSAVADYVRNNPANLEPDKVEDTVYRPTEMVAALALLSKPVDWTKFVGLGSCTEPNAVFDKQFLVLPTSPSCLAKVREFSCRIGYLCPN